MAKIIDFRTMSRTDYRQYWTRARRSSDYSWVESDFEGQWFSASDAKERLHIQSDSALLSLGLLGDSVALDCAYGTKTTRMFPSFQFMPDKPCINPMVALVNRFVLRAMPKNALISWWICASPTLPNNLSPEDAVLKSENSWDVGLLRQMLWIDPVLDPAHQRFRPSHLRSTEVIRPTSTNRSEAMNPKELYRQFRPGREWPGRVEPGGVSRELLLAMTISECMNNWVIQRTAQLEDASSKSMRGKAKEDLADLIGSSKSTVERLISGKRWASFHELCVLIENNILPTAVFEFALRAP